MKSARSWRLIRFSFVTDEGINFADRKKALEQRNKNARKKILPFVTQYHMGKWNLIQIHPYLRDIFKEPPLISYRKGKSLKNTNRLLKTPKLELNYKGFKTNLFANCRSRAGPSTLLNLEFQPVFSVSVPLGNKADQKLSSPFLI